MALWRYLRAVFCAGAFMAGISGLAAASYKGAIVVDTATGQTLFEENADVITPPASVTKLMTFLIVHDELAAGRLELTTPVTVTAEAARMGGSQVYLAENEVFSVEDLLHALMVNSANDAAEALALKAAGTRAAFVERMNTRAKEIGMANTVFRTPHGLPPANRKIEDGDLTTPRDLALLSAYLIGKSDILRYSSVRERVFRPGPKQIDMRNHNNLLGKLAGVDGLKTGFTNGAGFCLAATAQRNGRRLIVVTMGSPQSQVRDLDVAQLFEKHFASLPPVPTIVPGGAEPPVAKAVPAPVAEKKPAETKPAEQPAPAPAPSPVSPAPSPDGVPEIRFVMPGRKS